MITRQVLDRFQDCYVDAHEVVGSNARIHTNNKIVSSTSEMDLGPHTQSLMQKQVPLKVPMKATTSKALDQTPSVTMVSV